MKTQREKSARRFDLWAGLVLTALGCFLFQYAQLDSTISLVIVLCSIGGGAFVSSGLSNAKTAEATARAQKWGETAAAGPCRRDGIKN
ncbi:MAG: hypothetical protein H7Y60_16890 [Rhodospirillaceae bacterium]|nr:hypothetical protein [Rhodospirillales bacterium]